MKVIPVAILAGLLAGVLSVGLATETPPRPNMREKEEWSIDPPSTTITPDRPLDLPVRFGDFKLNCRIELPPDADVDLLFRKVEHWGDVQNLPIFHTRFAALRMSTRKEGPGFLTREQLLFEPDHGGIKFAPGQSGSLELSCRGRRVQAVVNGIELAPMETIDDFGNLALVSRDGVAVVHDFWVTPWPVARLYRPWIVGGVAGAWLGLLLGVMGASVVSMVTSLLAFGLGGLVASRVVFDQLLSAVAPSADGVMWGSLCLLPVAILLGVKPLGVRVRLLVAALVGLPAGLGLLELSARAESPNFAVLQDRRLDLVFGPESGAAPFEAVTRMLTCKHTKHILLSKRYDVMLLGGRTFFDLDESGGGPGRNVGTALPVLLGSKLRLPLDKSVSCAAIPTDVANAFQQYSIFARYYKDYRPKVVVLGLCDDEETVLPRDFGSERTPSGSVLLDLFQGVDVRSAAKPQSIEDLRATLDDLLALCKEQGSKLVLAVDQSLSKDFQRVALGFCGDHKIPFVSGFAINKGHYPVEALVEQVLSALIR